MYSNEEKIVPIYLETTEAFPFDDSLNHFFDFLRKLIEGGYKITVNRGSQPLGNPISTIQDERHLNNFIKERKRALLGVEQ